MADLLDALAKRLFRLGGRRLLSQQQTIEFLRPYAVANFPTRWQLLPGMADLADPARVVFAPKPAVPHTAFVWDYRPPAGATLLPSGNLLAGGQVFCTDFSLKDASTDLLRPASRPPAEAGLLLAPFGHYQDGVAFGGYYDFMLLVAAKLSLIREVYPGSALAEATVAYPLFGTDYEREMLANLGFRPDQICDSRQHDLRPQRTILANNGDWFYPNPALVLALRRQLLTLVPDPGLPRQRFYICRAGRRRVGNEAALTRMLMDYNFEIIEDQPRTIADQVALYQRASMILGPHGASFTNIVCCQPGTRLVELFAPGYVPDFFLYLTQILNMTYSAHVTGPKTYTPARVSAQDLAENMTISVSDVERGLNRIWEAEHR